MNIMDREKQIINFLGKNLSSFERIKIPGDASFRHYERIKAKVNNAEMNYILMDSPTETEDVKPFIKIAELLLENNFSAPIKCILKLTHALYLCKPTQPCI